MHTVILGQEEKHTVINDIKEFLLPSGVRWYSETGLPLYVVPLPLSYSLEHLLMLPPAGV